MMSSLLSKIGLLYIGLLLAFPQLALADLTISNYTLISKTRVGRTNYDYTFTASVTNTGPLVEGVSATLSYSESSAAVIDAKLTFGDVPASGAVTSSDTFTIRLNRSYAFNENALNWAIDYIPASISLSGQACLGPLAGAEVVISSLDGQFIVSGDATTSSDMATAGNFLFTLARADLPEVVLVSIYGGKDIDLDDDGTVGPETFSKGSIHAYITKEQVENGDFMVTPLTEIIYQDIAIQYPDGLNAMTASEITSILDAEAQKYLNGALSYRDILNFIPSVDKGLSVIGWDTVLQKLVAGVHAGEADGAIRNRVVLLNAGMMPTGTKTSDDGSTIVKLEDVAGDIVLTEVIKNNSDQVIVLEQKYIAANGAVVLVHAEKMTDTKSYLHVTISIAGHSLEFEGATTLLQEDILSGTDIAAAVSKLVSIQEDGDNSFNIIIDKALATKVSANEIVFTIDGREPTPDELAVVLDDPVINWKWSYTSSIEPQLIASAYSNFFPDATYEYFDDGTVVVAANLNDDESKDKFDMLSGRKESNIEARNATFVSVSADILNFGAYLAGRTYPIIGQILLASDAYWFATTLVPNASEGMFTSTRIALGGIFDGDKIIPGEKYSTMLFVRNKHSDGTKLKVSVRKSFSLVYNDMVSQQIDESYPVADLTVKDNTGYIIIPPQKVSFFMSQTGAGNFLTGVPLVTLGTETDKWEVVRREVIELANQQNAYTDFNYIVDGNSISLDASSCVSPDGTITTYLWTHNGTLLATGKTATIAAADIDDGVGIEEVTLTITSVTGVTGHSTKYINISGSSWNIPTEPAVIIIDNIKYYKSAMLTDADAIEQIHIASNWGRWKGFVSFYDVKDAKAICLGRGKRLPSSTELRKLYLNGTSHISWAGEYAPHRYWTSGGGYYDIGGGYGAGSSFADNYVLCVE